MARRRFHRHSIFRRDHHADALDVQPLHSSDLSASEARHLVRLFDALPHPTRRGLPASFKAMLERLRVDLVRAEESLAECGPKALGAACSGIVELVGKLQKELAGDAPVQLARDNRVSLLEGVFSGKLSDIEDAGYDEGPTFYAHFEATIPQLRDLAEALSPEWGSIYWSIVVKVEDYDETVAANATLAEAGNAVEALRHTATGLIERGLQDDELLERAQGAAVVLSVLPS